MALSETERERATWKVLVAAKRWREQLIPGTGTAPYGVTERLRDAVDELWPAEALVDAAGEERLDEALTDAIKELAQRVQVPEALVQPREAGNVPS
jgi:hypothetical protein